MPNVYAEIPNYAVVNALQELRDENKELKQKIEEHSDALEKLQKGFDTLDMEFRMLQHNHSCLLMTTRAQLQRKAQNAHGLNAGKDLMAMDGLKSGKPIRRHGNHCAKNPGWINYVRPSGRGNDKNKADNVKAENVNAENGNKQ